MNKTEKYNLTVFEYAALFVIIIVLIAGFLQLKNQEINFCRNVFKGLVAGRVEVQKFIDWEHLKALDADVGANYTRLPDEKEKSNYKKAFIKNFSLGFQRAGGKLWAFKHWRLYNKTNEVFSVAVDYPKYNKTLLFIFSQGRNKKLIGLEWKQNE